MERDRRVGLITLDPVAVDEATPLATAETNSMSVDSDWGITTSIIVDRTAEPM